MFRNLVLVGFMGSGKSSVGRLLSSLTGFALVDTDNLVAQEARLSIPEIFRRHGEQHFRELETAALRGLVGRIGLIVATGGGIVISPENRALLPRIGPVAWLDASPDHLHQRVRNSKRPLLQTDDPRGTLLELYKAREHLYRETATVRIDSSHLTHRQTAQAVLKTLEELRPENLSG
ncbi:MAG: shikimate kinase [Chthoniobacterales bacterium]|nr:shikimate kinase [Chthoniobacterales bacterium]